MTLIKRQCPRCNSARVIGFTREGVYSLNCLTCGNIERIDDREQALVAWCVEVDNG